MPLPLLSFETDSTCAKPPSPLSHPALSSPRQVVSPVTGVPGALSMASFAGLEKLVAHLKANGLAESIIKYMTDNETDGGLEFASISDLASAFKEDNCEDKVKEQILDNTDKRDSIVSLGRLRTAWNLARASLKRAAAAIETGKSDLDFDAPLDDNDEEKRRQEF